MLNTGKIIKKNKIKKEEEACDGKMNKKILLGDQTDHDFDSTEHESRSAKRVA